MSAAFNTIAPEELEQQKVLLLSNLPDNPLINDFLQEKPAPMTVRAFVAVAVR